MVFISDVQNYIPIKLCKTAGSIHLFNITGTLKAKNIKLNKNYIWDTLEIDWKEVIVTLMKMKSICQELSQLNSRTNQSETFDEQTFTFPPNAETRNYCGTL